jgi:hypothetical protein
VPEAKVVIDAVLALAVAAGTNILAAIIYDAAKGFLKRTRERVVFNLIFRESRRVPGNSKFSLKWPRKRTSNRA